MDGANLLTAYRRAANILRIEERKDGARQDAEPDEALLTRTRGERALPRSSQAALALSAFY